MRKITILLVLTLTFGFLFNSSAQTDRKLTKGFSINLVTGFPSASFGAEDDIADDFKYKTMFGIQIGNRWYFNPSDKGGIGLMANWVDITTAIKNQDNIKRATIDFSLAEIGPIGTIALSDDIAIDGYYNLRPTVVSSLTINETIDGDQTSVYIGFGASHAIGAAFRWKALNLGLEYVVGSIKSKGTFDGSTNLDLDDEKLKLNSVRIMLGVKF